MDSKSGHSFIKMSLCTLLFLVVEWRQALTRMKNGLL